MLINIKALILPWPWYPIWQADLAPGSKVNVQLRTSESCPNAYLMLFSKHQLSRMPFFDQGPHRPNSSFVTSMWRGSLAEPINATFTVDHGLYHTLGIYQAMPGAMQELQGQVGFRGPDGSHLTPEQKLNQEAATNLASLNLLCGLVFFFRMAYMYEYWTRLHLVMLLCFVAKGAVLTTLASDLEVMAKTGLQSPLRQLSWQIMRHLQESIVLIQFMLVGLGWKITRPSVRRAEFAFATISTALGLLLRSLESMCRVLQICNPQRYLLSLFMVNSLCSLLVIVSTNFNIFLLSRQIVDATANEEAGIIYAQLQAYLVFRLCFLYFIMIPVLCGMALQVVSMAMLQTLKEVLELLVMIVIAYLYRPGFTKAYRVFELCAAGRRDDSDVEESQLVS